MKKLFFGLLLLMTHQAFAYTSIAVVGDSFFDGGDTDTAVTSYYKLFGGGLTPPPYDHFRFTNGPTAAEYLANNLGLNNTSHFFNYAVGGATTNDIYSTVNSFLSTNPPLDTQGLYLLDGGGNDLLGLVNTPQDAAQNLVDTISLFSAHGANNFLVMGLPTNSIPSFSEFNSALNTKIRALSLPVGANVLFFDTAQFLTDAAANALGNGITNTTDPCLVGGIACANPEQYVFWDNNLHFTTKIHEYIGQALTISVTSAIPEPETYMMLLAGLCLLSLFRRGNKTKLSSIL